MDSFEFAAQRLQRDQSNLKGRRKVELSAQAVREAALRKKRQQELADQRTVKVQRRAALESFMRQCERTYSVSYFIQYCILPRLYCKMHFHCPQRRVRTI